MKAVLVATLFLLVGADCTSGGREVPAMGAGGDMVSRQEVHSLRRELRRQAREDWWQATFLQPMRNVRLEDLAITNASLDQAITRLNAIMSSATTNIFPAFVVEGDVPAPPFTFLSYNQQLCV